MRPPDPADGSTPAAGGVTALADGRLLALSNAYLLDGRVSTHPLDTRGYAPMQCYLLKEPDAALLIGTGWSVHQDAVLAQLEGSLGSARLSLLPMRLEFGSVCNARPIADRFSVDTVYERVPLAHPSEWLNFRPEFPHLGNTALQGARPVRVVSGREVTIAAGRKLTILDAPLRLIPTHWAYDGATRTLFTVDMFSWISRPTSAGPWVVTENAADSTTEEAVSHYLTMNRYWWLAGARTEQIRRDLAAVFDRFEIETIAPEWGCVLHGAKVVRRHYELLDGVLTRAETYPPHGLTAGRWTFASN